MLKEKSIHAELNMKAVEHRLNASWKIFQILSEQLEFETDMGFPDLKMCIYVSGDDRVKKVKRSKKISCYRKKTIILHYTFFVQWSVQHRRSCL